MKMTFQPNQSENEHKGWKKSFSCKKIKRKKKIISIKPKAAYVYVAFGFISIWI